MEFESHGVALRNHDVPRTKLVVFVKLRIERTGYETRFLHNLASTDR